MASETLYFQCGRFLFSAPFGGQHLRGLRKTFRFSLNYSALHESQPADFNRLLPSVAHGKLFASLLGV